MKQDAAKSYNSKVWGIAGDNKLRGYGWFPKDLRENVREKNIEEKWKKKWENEILNQ